MSSASSDAIPQPLARAAGATRLTLFVYFLLASNIRISWPPLGGDPLIYGSGGLKAHHMLALSLVTFLLFKRECPIAWPLRAFFAIGAATAAFAAMRGNLLLIPLSNFIYCAYAVIIGCALFESLGKEQFLRSLRIAGRLFAATCLIEAVVQFDQFSAAAAGLLPHPLTVLNGGGANIESTFFAFAVALELGTAWFWPMMFAGLLFAAGGASRSGQLVLLFTFGIWLWGYLSPRMRLFFLGALGATVGIVAVYFLQEVLSAGFLRRFATLGSETDRGFLGRVMVWGGALYSIREYPFGHGVGMAAPLVAAWTPFWHGEDNVHNIYLQFFVDLGVQSLVAFLIVAFFCVLAFVRGGVRHPIGAVIAAYLAVGLLELRGYDIFPFLLIGPYLTIVAPSLRRTVGPAPAGS